MNFYAVPYPWHLAEQTDEQIAAARECNDQLLHLYQMLMFMWATAIGPNMVAVLEYLFKKNRESGLYQIRVAVVTPEEWIKDLDSAHASIPREKVFERWKEFTEEVAGEMLDMFRAIDEKQFVPRDPTILR